MTPQEQIDHYLSIDMTTRMTGSNQMISRKRREMTLIIVARFGFVAPRILQVAYSMTRANTLKHLNRLTDEGYLRMALTERSPDGRIYVPTLDGIRFAEERLHYRIPFKSKTEPLMQVNANNILHDLMLMYMCLLKTGDGKNAWEGFVSELEFKRTYPASNIKNVDAIVQLDGTRIALEIENSFKSYQAHVANFQKYLGGIEAGYYEKVFFISANSKTLNDSKRFLEKARTEPSGIFERHDITWIKKHLVYRTKFCEELRNQFYI